MSPFSLTRPLILSVLLAGAVGSAGAQTFYFNDGRKASMPEARVSGTNIVVQIKLSGAEGGTAETSLPIAKLIRIDWPAPEELLQAEASLRAGKADEALAKIEPLLPSQEPLLAVPGSWWFRGAAVKLAAHAQKGQTTEANAFMERLRLLKAPATVLNAGELALIDQAVTDSSPDSITARLAALKIEADDDAGLAGVELIKGRVHEKADRTEEALLAYLRVSVYYPSATAVMPRALLGSSRCYRKLKDEVRAKAALETLRKNFPDAPEAASAKP